MLRFQNWNWQQHCKIIVWFIFVGAGFVSLSVPNGKVHWITWTKLPKPNTMKFVAQGKCFLVYGVEVGHSLTQVLQLAVPWKNLLWQAIINVEPPYLLTCTHGKSHMHPLRTSSDLNIFPKLLQHKFCFSGQQQQQKKNDVLPFLTFLSRPTIKDEWKGGVAGILYQHTLCRQQGKPWTCCRSITELTQIDR